jgi:hypothetical protein
MDGWVDGCVMDDGWIQGGRGTRFAFSGLQPRSEAGDYFR